MVPILVRLAITVAGGVQTSRAVQRLHIGRHNFERPRRPERARPARRSGRLRYTEVSRVWAGLRR